MDETKLRSGARSSGGLSPTYFYIIVAFVFVADQLSKAWIMRELVSVGATRDIFGKAFALTYQHNAGGAWGLAPDRNIVFIVFAAIAIVALLYAYGVSCRRGICPRGGWRYGQSSGSTALRLGH